MNAPTTEIWPTNELWVAEYRASLNSGQHFWVALPRTFTSAEAAKIAIQRRPDNLEWRIRRFVAADEKEPA
jgi:hypothetical protein